jgi:hypothetical protein
VDDPVVKDDLAVVVKTLLTRVSDLEEQLEKLRLRLGTVERTLTSVVGMDYPAFRAASREAYDRLNQANRGFVGVVPISELRRAVGARLTRQEFDDNLLRMHHDNVIQLMPHPGSISEERQKEGLVHPVLGVVFFVRWERQA